MRRILASIALVALPFVVQAQSPTDLWKIAKFSVELNVRPDGVTEVTETIDADFIQPRHGIYRYVPEKAKAVDGKTYDLGLSLDKVTMDGGYARVDESRANGNVVWKIGDPNRTITGRHEYVIRYFARNAIGRYQDHDEIYWNVSGDGWDVPIPVVSTKVFAPLSAPPDKIQSACYTGPYGSKETDCTVVSAGTIIGFVTKSAGEPMTVAVGWPKGLVAAPTTTDRIRDFILANGILGLPIAALIVMYLRWRRRGKDKPLGAVVAQYEPPEGMGPAAVVSLLSQDACKNAATVTIIDLAARGYVSITESGQLPLWNGTNYLFKMEKDGRSDASLNPYERSIIDDLFRDGVEVKLSRVRGSIGDDALQIKGLVEDGYFARRPDWTRFAHLLVAFSVFFIGAVSMSGNGRGILSVFLTALVIAGFGWVMPQWTEKGWAAATQARGFKEFVTRVEKYRGPWMAEQNIFEKVLPYAMAFGVITKWCKAFEGLSTPSPTWYHGATGAAWSPSVFAHSMNGFSSGFGASGGGGSSGGGGGGGGGGSW